MRTYVLPSIFIALTLLCVREISLLPSGKLELHILDVGQGDSILLQTPSGNNIVVDGGPDLSALTQLGTHLSFFRHTIDLLVLTHSDADHITALPEILRRYDVHTVLLSGRMHSTGRVDAFIDALAAEKSTVLLANASTDIVFNDGVTLDVVWPTKEATEHSALANNNLSVVLRVLYKHYAILLTGDIEEEAERAILITGSDIDSNVLKVAHHGSRTSSSTGFLLATTPGVALISVAKDSKFGHPHQEIIDRYATLGIPVRTTAAEGTISLEFP